VVQRAGRPPRRNLLARISSGSNRAESKIKSLVEDMRKGVETRISVIRESCTERTASPRRDEADPSADAEEGSDDRKDDSTVDDESVEAITVRNVAEFCNSMLSPLSPLPRPSQAMRASPRPSKLNTSSSSESAKAESAKAESSRAESSRPDEAAATDDDDHHVDEESSEGLTDAWKDLEKMASNATFESNRSAESNVSFRLGKPPEDGRILQTNARLSPNAGRLRVAVATASASNDSSTDDLVDVHVPVEESDSAAAPHV
jgi:hypothetical protein